MTQLNLLSRINIPAPDFSEPSLYFRSPAASVDVDGLVLGSGQRVTFDTSFGVLPIGQWRSLTAVRHVVATLDITGNALIELIGAGPLGEFVIDSATSGTALECTDITTCGADVLYVAVSALEAGVLVRGGRWSTTDEFVREVRLGVAITTFNRQEYVLKTIDRLIDIESSVPELNGNVKILVVDNARNLQPSLPPSAPVQLLPNPNLGGAGGFARGIMEYRSAGWSTHVVLMDDDILLEPESIVRTVQLLKFATSPDLCVHGAMLSEERPWMQFEAGSMYKFKSIYPLRALGRFIDLRERSEVLGEYKPEQFDYSAWWFTVFPMHLAKENPLPVFVRGDDVAFGLMHTGKTTVTMNGIVVWHADFALKNNPSSLYYEIRNFALIDTLVFDNHHWWHLAMRYVGFGFRNVYSHRYASADYMVRGMKQFLEGPEAWKKIDHAALHDEIRMVNEEKASPLSDEQKALGFTAPRRKIVRLIGYILAVPTMGGHLVPPFLRARVSGVAQIDVRAVGLAIRHKEILYRHPRIDEGFVVSRDWQRVRILQREVFTTTWRLIRTYKKLKRDYRAQYPSMVSDAAWQARFNQPV